ncbi:hypothetical protein [Paenibacillus sp. MMS20-IR301]|uniref:hypothetical protein n=1 Tax=Paenibacillus sp. MMS20-IR301 TaxID=2895946 RepID=UPI0028F15F4C|nr:hypothetical protein [Paenibacillus sp. MMS20-IR301]WNS45902.1 hypothetical protein LOS79_11710 [Paenibacillus sp. MMS20-IR301]
MKKLLHVLLLPAIMLMLLTSCNTETTHYNYTFRGESETWSAVFEQEASQKLVIKNDRVKDSVSSKRYSFELKYKGKQSDLGEIKQLTYKYKGRSGGGSQTMEGPVPVALLKMGGNGSGSFEHEDSVIKVNVEWDGHSEEFELKNGK